MKVLILFVVMLNEALADVSCYQTSGLTTCSNGLTAYQIGNMTQYNMPNGENVTIWNSNINRYQEVPMQTIPPIVPIMPIDSRSRMFEPLK